MYLFIMISFFCFFVFLRLFSFPFLFIYLDFIIISRRCLLVYTLLALTATSKLDSLSSVATNQVAHSPHSRRRRFFARNFLTAEPIFILFSDSRSARDYHSESSDRLTVFFKEST